MYQILGRTSEAASHWQIMYDEKLMADTVRKLAQDGIQKNIAMDGDTEVDYTYWKDKF